MVKKLVFALVNVFFVASCAQPEENTGENSENVIVIDNSDNPEHEGSGDTHALIEEYPSIIDSTIQSFFEQKSGDKEFEIYNKSVFHPLYSSSEYSGDSLLASSEGIDTSSIMVDVEVQIGETLHYWNFSFESSGEFIMEIEQ